MSAPDLEKRDLRYWPRAAQDEWAERAGILESDAGLSRQAAEVEARRMVAERWAKAAKTEETNP